MPTPEAILKRYWGYDSFRPLQKDIINYVVKGADVVALLPTGGGKSVCYQVPAMALPHLTIVISPLIALMVDQVERLTQVGIPAVCLHSGMKYYEVRECLERCRDGEYKLLYVSPERLQTRAFEEIAEHFEVSLIAIDEAHCVSQWGHDFRPDYLKIVSFLEMHPKAPVLALTATATEYVLNDIRKYLRLRSPSVFKQSFARKNIFFSVQYSENKSGDVIEALKEGSNIIYCRSRKLTEFLADTLVQSGVGATFYHAGLAKEQRNTAQKNWMKNEAPVMVATTAFGMGIDKPDVRSVIHHDAPESPEAWYQEAGRAGRDGEQAFSTTFFNSGDIKRLRESVEIQFPEDDYLRKVYQNICEFLQLPIGAEPYTYFSFDPTDFCEKFGHQLMRFLPAAKLLEREGLWTMTESFYHPSTVKFDTDRDTLDALKRFHPDLDFVAVGLLRLFNGIFYHPARIREKAVARNLKITVEQLTNALVALDKMEIIEYNKASEGPQLIFHHERVDSKHLFIDYKKINKLKQLHIDRTEAMILMLENEQYCREWLVLTYFGEKPQKRCGHCDICQLATKEVVGNQVIRFRINQLLAGGEQSFRSIIAALSSFKEKDVLDTLREMTDEHKISINDDMVTVL